LYFNRKRGELMDYGAVAPGADTDKNGQPTHERKLRIFFDLLGVTRPLGVESVGGLVNFVNVDPTVPPIIGDLYVGAHSNRQGGLAMQMAVGQTPEKNGKFFSDYETIEDTMDGTITAIDIDDTKIGPDPTTHSLHFKGCNLGKAVPLLQKWKEALGGKVKLSAPKYNHGLVGDDGQRGLWEYLQYEFEVTSPEPIASRDVLIQIFQSEKFTFLETKVPGGGLVPGPAVPDDNWKTWLPPELDMATLRDPVTRKPVIDPATKKPKRVIAQQTKPQWRQFDVKPLALPRGTVMVNEEFSADVQPFPRPILYGPGQTIPTDHATQMANLKDNLLADEVNTNLGRKSRFRKADQHPFPAYARWGYDGVDSFLDGFTWRFTRKAGSRTLHARGTRYRYTLLIALTDPNPGPITTQSGLLTNFHPLTGTFTPGTDLPLDDSRFFTIV
jgi:hypothetical protein